MWLILNSFVVFSLTLILTKSKVLAGKREFVERRYEAAKVGNQKPGWIHRWWHAVWTCPMCSGFWVSIPVCFFCPAFGIFVDVLVVFGINWLLHCLENLLFFSGEVVNQLDEINIKEYLTSKKDFRDYVSSILNKIERNFRYFVDNSSR